ncbi:Wound-induced protein 1, partial [Musa troglodytarum]
RESERQRGEGSLLLSVVHRVVSRFELELPKRESERQRGEGSDTGARHELANAKGESVEDRNKWAVLTLYEALNARDVERVQQLLAPDIEWWFHGPPEHQHMMRMLTGADEEETAATAFRFQPDRVAAFGFTVVAEGSAPDAAWVHAWTVAPDGIITQVREYFNTSLTITRVAASSASSKDPAGSTHCLPLWQSRRPDPPVKSFPGLVLAI